MSRVTAGAHPFPLARSRTVAPAQDDVVHHPSAGGRYDGGRGGGAGRETGRRDVSSGPRRVVDEGEQDRRKRRRSDNEQTSSHDSPPSSLPSFSPSTPAHPDFSISVHQNPSLTPRYQTYPTSQLSSYPPNRLFLSPTPTLGPLSNRLPLLLFLLLLSDLHQQRQYWRVRFVFS